MWIANSPPPKQVLLRLPDDVSAKLARAVAPRKRNQFLVDLVRRELEKEDQALIAACDGLNRMEAGRPAFREDASQWMEADLDRSADAGDMGFDAEAFSREADQAQKELLDKQPPKRRKA